MKKICLSFLCLCFLASCGKQAVTEIILKNPSDRERLDEAFVVTRPEIDKGNQKLWPVVKNGSGEYVPCQLDDLDRDGEWDELAFVYSFQPLQQCTLKIEWVTPDEFPVFPQRTNVHYGKMTSPGVVEELMTDTHDKYNLPRGGEPHLPYPYQMDGPAWENDKVGFRHYFDGRNCRDVFGKLVPEIVLPKVGIRDDGTPGDTYHVLDDWGRDIMSAGASFGLGGLAVQLPDTLLRLGVMVTERTDNVEKTHYTCISRGPVRTIFDFDFEQWHVGNQQMNVHNRVTIWVSKYGYENEITATKLPAGANLITGIVSNNNDMPTRFYDHGDVVSMSTHDMQTYNKQWYLGMSLIIPTGNYVETFEAPEEGSGITQTWCVKLQPDKENTYRFNVYAAWEMSDIRFVDRDYYMSIIDGYAQNIVEPIILVLK